MATLERKIITVSLPSFDDPADPVTAEVYEKVTAGDYDDMPETDGKPREALYYILSKIVKSWTLKTISGDPLPVTIDNIRLLPMNDVTAIREATGMDKQLSTSKKNS